MRNVILIILFFSTCIESAKSQAKQDIRESRIAPEIKFALAGDAIITRKISPYKDPQFLSMIHLIRSADVGFVNCEMQFFNYEDAYPAAQSGGTWMRARPELAQELKWAGFDIFSLANNHSLDYGTEGLISTMKTLRKNNMPFAGAGMNLAEAQAPAYFESDAGRVGLISVSSTFAPGDNAGPQRKDMKGRPGLNPLLYETTYTISPRSFKNLIQIGKEANIKTVQKNNELKFLGNKFTEGSAEGMSTRLVEKNADEILASIRDASRQADWVIVNSHTHEGKGNTPPEFLVDFAHRAIDAGADIVVVEGHHENRPIEIYKNRPIFYSLADFIFENETVQFLPGDMYQQFSASQDSLPGYLQDKRIKDKGKSSFVANSGVWESFIAVPVFRNSTGKQEKELLSLKLYPISLGNDAPRSQRGRPRLANKQHGRAIIEKLARMSIPYGTKIIYNENENIGEVLLQ